MTVRRSEWSHARLALAVRAIVTAGFTACGGGEVSELFSPLGSCGEGVARGRHRILLARPVCRRGRSPAWRLTNADLKCLNPLPHPMISPLGRRLFWPSCATRAATPAMSRRSGSLGGPEHLLEYPRSPRGFRPARTRSGERWKRQPRLAAGSSDSRHACPCDGFTATGHS